MSLCMSMQRGCFQTPTMAHPCVKDTKMLAGHSRDRPKCADFHHFYTLPLYIDTFHFPFQSPCPSKGGGLHFMAFCSYLSGSYQNIE